MSWWTVIALIFTYGPKLIMAVVAFIESVKKKNPSQGKEAVTLAADMAEEIVISLMARNDLTNAQKREQAWKDLQVGAKQKGVVLSETNARTAAQNAFQDASGK